MLLCSISLAGTWAVFEVGVETSSPPGRAGACPTEKSTDFKGRKKGEDEPCIPWAALQESKRAGAGFLVPSVSTH